MQKDVPTHSSQQKQTRQFGGNVREEFNVGDSVFFIDYKVTNTVLKFDSWCNK